MIGAIMIVVLLYTNYIVKILHAILMIPANEDYSEYGEEEYDSRD